MGHLGLDGGAKRGEVVGKVRRGEARFDGHHAAADVDADRRRDDRPFRRNDAADGRAKTPVDVRHDGDALVNKGHSRDVLQLPARLLLDGNALGPRLDRGARGLDGFEVVHVTSPSSSTLLISLLACPPASRQGSWDRPGAAATTWHFPHKFAGALGRSYDVHREISQGRRALEDRNVGALRPRSPLPPSRRVHPTSRSRPPHEVVRRAGTEGRPAVTHSISMSGFPPSRPRR